MRGVLPRRTSPSQDCRRPPGTLRLTQVRRLVSAQGPAGPRAPPLPVFRPVPPRGTPRVRFPAGGRLAHLAEDVRIAPADLRRPRPAQHDHRLLIVMSPGRPEEAADEVAQASEVLIVRHAKAVTDGQHRMGPGSPFADEDHPGAAADRRTGCERHDPEITQQGWPRGGLISPAERKTRSWCPACR